MGDHRTFETRNLAEIELRDGEGQMPKIFGYAAVFGAKSSDLGGFYEVVERGAYAQTIEGDDIVAAVDHDLDRPLGRTSRGTLRLSEDERGLLIEIEPPNTQAGRDVIENIRRGDKDGLSVGFYRGAQDSWGTDDDGQTVRTIHQARLRDVSVVTMAAFPDTSVALRSLQDYCRSPLYRGRARLMELENELE